MVGLVEEYHSTHMSLLVTLILKEDSLMNRSSVHTHSLDSQYVVHIPEFLSWVTSRLESLFLISSTAAVMLKSAGTDFMTWGRKKNGM